MLKLMLVAGDRVDALVDFFTEQGTFSIECAYNNLTDNADDIQSKIIRVDKFLYIYNVTETGEPTLNIKSDMQFLRNLLTSDGYFRPGEIIFLSNNSSTAKDAVMFFKTVLEDCNYDNYSIKLLDSVLTFPAIYSAIMGVSSMKDFNNGYRTLYRVERNAESTLAFSPSDDASLSVEPFSYDNLKNYNSQKELYTKLDSGNIIFDSAEQEKTSLHSPSFDRISYDNKVLRRKLLLLSGKAISGKATWASVLTSSGITAGHKLFVFDFTSSSKIASLLETVQNVNVVTMQEVLTSFVDAQCTVCRPKNHKEESVRLEFLQNIFGSDKYNFDTVIIVVDSDLFASVYKELGDIIDICLYTVVPFASNVDQAIAAIGDCSIPKRLLILDECVKTIGDSAYLSAEKIKELIGSDIGVIKNFTFENFDVGPAIFNSVVR